jgi:hypothetical protein
MPYLGRGGGRRLDLAVPEFMKRLSYCLCLFLVVYLAKLSVTLDHKKKIEKFDHRSMTKCKGYGEKRSCINLMYCDDIESEHPPNTGRTNLPLKKSCSEATKISLPIILLPVKN